MFSSSTTSVEKAFVDKVISHMRTKPLNLAGKTNLHELLALLRYSELLISPDSGPAHLATCENKPVIGLYGVTNTVRAGPYNSRRFMCRQIQYCVIKIRRVATSMKQNGDLKINNKNVMSLISTEEVIKKN